MQTISFPQSYGFENRISPRNLLAVVALHAAAVAVLLSMNVLPLPPRLTTLMVSVIQSDSPSPAEVAPIPLPVSRPVPLPRPQTLAAKADEPAAAVEVPVVDEVQPPAAAPAAVAGPLTNTEVRFDAAYLRNPPPPYPAVSRRMGEEGKVVLRVFVEPDGHPSQIEVKAGSASPRLDRAAQEAVWHWKFVPARRGDEAVGAWVLVPVIFSLKG